MRHPERIHSVKPSLSGGVVELVTIMRPSGVPYRITGDELLRRAADGHAFYVAADGGETHLRVVATSDEVYAVDRDGVRTDHFAQLPIDW